MIFKHRLIIYQVSILGKKKGKFVSGRSNIVVHCVNGEEVGYGIFVSLPGVIKRNSSSKQFSIECRKLSGIVLFFALWLVQKTRAPFSTNQMQN